MIQIKISIISGIRFNGSPDEIPHTKYLKARELENKDDKWCNQNFKASLFMSPESETDVVPEGYTFIDALNRLREIFVKEITSLGLESLVDEFKIGVSCVSSQNGLLWVPIGFPLSKTYYDLQISPVEC